MLANEMSIKAITEIENIHLELEKKYPTEAFYGSKASLFGRALSEKVITEEQHVTARNYYGRLWNYAGD